MKKTTIRRVFLLLLALTMLLPAAVSCTKKPQRSVLEDDLSKVQKVKLEHVYKTIPLKTDPTSENKDVDDYYEYLIDVVSNDGKLYFTTNFNYSETDEYNSIWTNGIRLYCFDIEKDEKTLLAELTSENEEGENFYRSSDYQNAIPCADGSCWVVKNEYYDDWSDPENYVWEQNTSLVHLDADGNELASFSAKELDEENPYINNFEVLPDGRLLAVIGNNQIFVISADGSESKPFSLELGESDWLNNVLKLGNGDVIGIVEKYDPVNYTSKMTAYRFDPDAAKAEELTALPENCWQYFEGMDGEVYTNSGSALLKVDLATGETKEEINWLNSDINSDRLGIIACAGDGQFVISEYDKNWENMTFSKLERVAEGDIVEKYVINFAAVYLDQNVRDALISFNKTNEEYRIVYQDYSQYAKALDNGEYESGTTQLNNDIISGKIPDMFLMEGLNYDTYAAKGLLADIGAMMEADENFDRSRYFENILDASMYRGKIYSVIPAYYINTYAAKQSIVGQRFGWNYDDLKAVTAQYPDAEVFSEMQRADVLRLLVAASLPQLVNFETGECRFNDPAFVSILELAAALPETIDWDSLYEDESYWELNSTKYLENRALLANKWLSGYDNLSYLSNEFGEAVSLIGVPTLDGSCGSFIEPMMEIAVSADSPLQGVCWKFISYLLSEEFQSGIQYGFTLSKAAMAESAKKAIESSKEEYDRIVKFGDIYDVYDFDMMASSVAVEENAEGEEVTVEETGEIPEIDEEGTDEIGEVGEIAEIGGEDFVESDDVYLPSPMPEYGYEPLTEEKVAELDSLIGSLKIVARTDSSEKIYTVIEEEAGAFFSGDKSASDVAAIIQSRVRQIVGELM